MSSVVTASQTRNPFAHRVAHTLDDETWHHLPIQKDDPSKNYVSPLPDYLAAESPTNPGHPMYEIVADGAKNLKERAMAGGFDMVLLRCRQADFRYILNANAEAAKKQVRKAEKEAMRGIDGKTYESETTVSNEKILVP